MKCYSSIINIAALDRAIESLALGIGTVLIRRAMIPLPKLEENHVALKELFESRVRLRSHTTNHSSFVWDIRSKAMPDPAAYQTFSETTDVAWFHTDSSYSANPEQYIALWCLKPAECGGGISQIVDGNILLASIGAENERIPCVLRQPFPFRVPDVFRCKGDPSYTWAPILSENGNWRYRRDTLLDGIRTCLLEDSTRLEAAVREVEAALGVMKTEKLRLECGDLLLINNGRVLHSRTAFSDTSRHLLRIRFDL